MALKQDGVHFVLCPKQCNRIEGVVLNRACILMGFCPKLGQVSNPQRLTYTQILVKYLPLAGALGGGGGAETNTILKIEKPLRREDPWNEEDHVTVKSGRWTTVT